MRETWLLLRHHLRLAHRHRLGLLVALIQPLLFLALFGPLFVAVGTWQTLVPGLMVQLALLSAGLAGFGVVFDRRFGVLERLRVTPASRVSLLLGRVLSDMAGLLLQTALLVAAGYAFGLRAPLPGVLAGLLLMLVAGIGLAALSYAVALTLDENLFAPVMTTAVVPVMLLSGVFLPMSMAPPWLEALSQASPFRHTVEALRALFAGHYLTGPVIAGTAVTVVFAAAGLAAGTRVFGRATS
ncbi:ABC transporter permease [Thermoactinospora rubra]|uniref:ABC transporter permease n=1 Tax=Thermoactinospora rubra TaxID=1088767 RepID=UPI000A10864B|nr:ABC transporter permease [Thermoactinospora rubra]